jgi:hypothetical protein
MSLSSFKQPWRSQVTLPFLLAIVKVGWLLCLQRVSPASMQSMMATCSVRRYQDSVLLFSVHPAHPVELTVPSRARQKDAHLVQELEHCDARIVKPEVGFRR